MLQDFLVTQLFTFLLIFCRVGSGIMVLPGIGEMYVLVRIRLGLALMVALVLVPVVSEHIPPIPTSPLGLMVLLAAEILTGLFIGGISRILIGTMHTAGMVVAMQSGLAAASMFDITQASQGSTIGNLLSLTALMLIFALDLHHIMLKGLADSYTLFEPGQFPPVEDFANLATTMVSKCYTIAIQFASPLLVVGFLVYLAAGVLSRLMPTMQVFFVIISAQILASFFLLMGIISGAMLWYINFFEEALIGFVAP